ncbi:MAG: DNA internalization-related competence protein ComEC/Rec2 [Chloroflexota bacterium]
MLLIYLSLAFLAGIFLGSLFNLPALYLAIGVIPLIPIVFFRHRWKQLLSVSLCLFALLGGMVRYPASLPTINENHLAYYNDRGTVTVTGMVISDPEQGNRATTIRISAQSVRAEGVQHDISGEALVRVPPTSDYRYGDILGLTGMLESPKAFEDFDYPAYLARQGIYSVISFPRAQVLARGQGWPPLQWLHTARYALAQSLSRVLPEPQSAIAVGILLGMRSGIPADFNKALSETGTTHILAISGLNLTIVLGIMLGAMVWLIGRRHYIYVWLTMAGMWLYVLLTGMQPPVVRAAVMGSMFLLAEFFGRQKSAINALIFTGAVMAGFQPQVLWQAGFQMSFLAMAGLVLLSPHWQAWGREQVSHAFGEDTLRARGFAFLTDSLAVTAAATVAVYPVIAYYFDIVSLVGLPATVFGALALPGIIVSSAITAVLGLIAWPLGWVAGWIAWLFISYLVLVVQSFHALPLASLPIAFGGWYVLAYYLALAAVFTGVKYRRRIAAFFGRAPEIRGAIAGRLSTVSSRPALKWVIVPLLIIACLVWTAALTLPDEQLCVSILDVGQGDAILIQTPDRQKVLIDGGPGVQDTVNHLGRMMPFWDRTIDLVVLTQPQADHLTGLLPVLDRYQVKKVAEPGLTYSSVAYRQWLSALAANDIEHTIARAGQYFDLGRGIRLDILHPGEKLLTDTADDINNNALVMRLSWCNVNFLLAGDIAYEAELELLTNHTPLKSSVLKVAHHGSRTSTSAQFLEAISPGTAVISAGANNSFGHPHAEVVARLKDTVGESRLYITAVPGTVEFTTDGERLWVKTDR